jgi:hypothetical protein
MNAAKAICCFVLVGFVISAPLALAQPDPSIFDPRRYVPPPTPPPQPPRPPQPAKSIPRVALITGAVVLLILTGLILFRAVRAWRSSNLFDRQYRFPAPDPAALRFGADRCGGQMATINFGGKEKGP